jgi:ComF family protein
MQNLMNDLLWIIFPKLCASCNNALGTGEKVICTHCRYHLPYTYAHSTADNVVVKRLWGKANISTAASFLFYGKGGKVQQLIHQFKYYGQKEVGIVIGKLYGHDLKNADPYKSAEVIIPVPLHPSKQQKRGFNQSEIFAQGLSHTMNIPCDFNSLIRKNATETQTRKTRYRRFENVNHVFELVNRDAVRGKHVLLVDDVITTGSTLTACAEELLKIEGTRVSIATMACVG